MPKGKKETPEEKPETPAKKENLIGKSNDPDTAGVLGEGPTGVYGRNVKSPGNGVIGYSDEGRGVWGHSKKKGIGVLGEGVDAEGVKGTSQKSAGVLGEGPTGVYGRNVDRPGNGVIGYSDEGRGVWGHSKKKGIGVLGESVDAEGVMGVSQKGVGVHGKGGRFAGFFEGDVYVTGNLCFPNADCAEDFNIGSDVMVEPGTVMVLGKGAALLPCEGEYDRCVAGVVSGAGSYKPGIVMDKQRSDGPRQPIALLGKVYCKVDAQFGAIDVGDMLTTSAVSGHAMKATDPVKAFGAVIGKALGSLKEGQGLIPILIALQ